MEGGAGEAEQALPELRRRATGRAGEGKGKKKEKEALTGWARLSAATGKKKNKKGRRAAAGKVKRAAGLLGRKGEVRFSFSFFSFLTPFQIKPFEFKFN
jgi:hypothetical protein